MKPSGSQHRCGVVALLGRPNAGKSTLLNALLGEKLVITSTRARTTRGSILGVLTQDQAQIIFYDTPGIHRGRSRFNLSMTEGALACGRDANLRLLLLDAAATWDEPEARVAALVGPTLLVRTKIDQAAAAPVPGDFERTLAVSSTTGVGLAELMDEITQRLPLGPARYPEDYLTDRSMRFLAAEQIREVVFEIYREEIPYAIAVEVEQWREEPESIRIRANLLVEHEHQKRIVIGTGGRVLRDVGSEARRRLGHWSGKTVHLALWVKTERNWARQSKRAQELGYF